METLSNMHRIFLPTSFVAKQIGDVGGTIFYDRIVNSLHIGDKQRNVEARARRDAARLALEE